MKWKLPMRLCWRICECGLAGLFGIMERFR
jgi:hypothetical protein